MAETIGLFILESIGATASITGIGAATVTVAGVSAATIVGTAAIIGASIGLNYALASSVRPDVPKPEDGSQSIKQAVPPRIKGFGTNRLAGYAMLYEASPTQRPGKAYVVNALHSGVVGAFRGFYLNDDLVNTIGDITHGGAAQVAAQDDKGKYAAIYLETHLGIVPEIPNSLLTVDPQINGLWGVNHRGDGVASLTMLCNGISSPQNFTNVYPHNLPSPSAIVDCSPVWDPRDPAQSRSNPATWTVNKNPVLQLIFYLTAEDGGVGLDFDAVIGPNLAAWMGEADLCDQPVARSDGSMEPRYRSDGWYTYDNAPADVIGSILSTCDGWLGEAGDGSLVIVVGVYRPPADPPITADHVLGFSLDYGQADEQLINVLDVTFTDPAQNYVTVPTEPWRDEASISLVGETKSKPLELKWVQSSSQARRLADRAMQRLNPQLTGSFTTTLYGLRYLGRRWVPIQYPFVSGLQNNVVEIQNAEVDLMRGRILWQFSLIATDTIEAYDPATDEGGAPASPPSIVPVLLRREDGNPYIREDGTAYMREASL
ncbi:MULTISPECIES: phage tail protein [unclassified Bradyrhizobium]|uniref:phage tail protein n=1 Tax=unclassified Bradyrhizobium TaxID=2631580 RepID=UPI0029169197|nr:MULTISPECIES: phage tail protein [unclassified Bradyrhizobium]